MQPDFKIQLRISFEEIFFAWFGKRIYPKFTIFILEIIAIWNSVESEFGSPDQTVDPK